MGQWRYTSSSSSSKHVIYVARLKEGKEGGLTGEGRNIERVKLIQEKESNRKKNAR